MDQFFDIVSGDDWQPEPAARFNAVNRLLRRTGALAEPGLTGGVPDADRINVCNRTGKVLAGCSPVVLSAAQLDELSPAESPFLNITGQPYSEGCLWGVIATDLADKECGVAQVAGTAVVKVNGSEVLPFVRPAAWSGGVGLFYTNETVCPVLAGDPGSGYALVVLMNVSPVYSGGFKLIDAREFDSNGEVTKYAVRVINGADPGSEYCGQTDLGDSYPGSLTEVETATLEGVSGTAYLAARWNSDTEKYEFAVTAETAGWTAWQMLGSWYFGDGAGTVSQYWQGGEIIYFGERFYI